MAPTDPKADIDVLEADPTLEDPVEVLGEIRQGLTSSPRTLPCRLLYDDRGAELFERIMELDEYYPTRTEMKILRARAGEVAELVGPRVRVVEYGSGSGDKSWILLESLEDPVAYVPVDVAREQLADLAARVNRRFPDLEVLPVAADYTALDDVPSPRRESRATLAFFPGSTVGNLEPDDAVEFLRQIGEMGGDGSYLLLGVDLVKDPEILRRAYDDAEGVTAAFNRNILRHLNRLLDGDFQVNAFRHQAVWNPEASRMEMHLVCEEPQEVTLGADPETEGDAPAAPLRLRIEAGESIVTEHCYKYTLDSFRKLAARAGYAPVEAWTDENELFSVHLLTWTSAGSDESA